MSDRGEWRFHMAGWLLFIMSAVFFIWAALRAGDIVGLVASLLFFLACLFFLWPLWRNRPTR